MTKGFWTSKQNRYVHTTQLWPRLQPATSYVVVDDQQPETSRQLIYNPLQLQLHNRRRVNTTLQDYPVSLQPFQGFYSISRSTHHSHFHTLKQICPHKSHHNRPFLGPPKSSKLLKNNHSQTPSKRTKVHPQRNPKIPTPNQVPTTPNQNWNVTHVLTSLLCWWCRGNARQTNGQA